MPDEPTVLPSEAAPVIAPETLSEDHWTHDRGFDEPTQKVMAKFGTETEALAAHVELEAYRGRSIALPKDDASEAEKTAQMDKVYAKLGVPPNEAGYDFKMPDNIPKGMEPSEAAVAEFKALGIALKLTDAQMAGLAKFDMDKTIKAMEAGKVARDAAEANRTAERKAENDKAMAALKEEWGPEYVDRVDKAALAHAKYGSKTPADWTKYYYQVYLDKMAEDILVPSQGRAAEGAKDFFDPASYPTK